MQNLFGEGVLSASFIPVYARLLGQDDRVEASRVAGAVFSLLTLVTSALVLLGIIATPALIAVIAPGFSGQKREITITLVRILFPGAGLLVLSAWCLGVLNSHRRFFLSYTAPVLWNLAIIFTLIAYGRSEQGYALAQYAAWGSVAGSALQFGVQLPLVLRLLGGLPLTLSRASASVRTIIRNFIPVFIGRGVVQISAYVDTVLASLLPTGAVAAISYAQVLYTLPVSLFGMSVSAAELPALSSVKGEPSEQVGELRTRINRGLRQIAFFVIPSSVVFLALGDVVVAALYETGEFTRPMSLYVWGILAGSAVGLLPSTLGRLYSSGFYALQDTRTPLRYGIVRVVLTIGVGLGFALQLPGLLGVEARWGAAGLTLAGGLAACVEYGLLRKGLTRRIGKTRIPKKVLIRLWGGAAAAAIAGAVVKLAFEHQHPILVALFSLGMYGIAYVAITAELGVPEARQLLGRFRLFR